MTRPLYEISSDMRALEKLLDEGEIDQQTLNDTMEGVEMAFDEKAKAIGMVFRNMDGDIAALDTEIARLADRKKVIKNREASLKEYLKHNMQATGISKIEHPLFAIVLAKGRDVVEITDEESLPDEFVTVRTVVAADKRALLAALKKGDVVEGARLVKSEPSLRIK